MENADKKTTGSYKQRLCEMNIVLYNTVILQLLKSNIVQSVTCIYAMLMYLTFCMCKPEHTMSESKKKASKDSHWNNDGEKLSAIENVFITKHEVATHEAIKQVLSLSLRTSNIAVIYIPNTKKMKN